MPNMDFNSPALATARWHMECPLCLKAKGSISFKESIPASGTEIICERCGLLGVSDYVFDWAIPPGVTSVEHGQAASILFSMWLKDNPPDAVTQLAAVANRPPALQSGDEYGDARTPCPTCGRSAPGDGSAGINAEARRLLA